MKKGYSQFDENYTEEDYRKELNANAPKDSDYRLLLTDEEIDAMPPYIEHIPTYMTNEELNAMFDEYEKS